jgi:hypothetical protein
MLLSPMDLGQTATLPATAAPVAPPTGTAIAAGSRLGHFRIERKLGAGGMGEVYLATDLALDRPVAIKLLPAHATDDAAGRDRLVREARAQARVVHPNVGHIYFIGEEHGRLYFAMEYVPGETLAERVARGPMPVEAALAAIRGAVLGLREAHRAGFTHRDVKPSNLMLDAHGEVKVLDFGLVSASAGEADQPVAQTSLAGTPLYMAPEQARGEPVDVRADIYALGATLFHLLSGTPPYVAETAKDLATLHATAVRPVLPRRGAPRGRLRVLDALVARMMAPSPGSRFASYDELLHALALASLTQSRPAGFVVRSIAVLIDLMAIAIVSAIATLAVTRSDGDVGGELAFTVLALVYTVALVRWGRTPGMALLQLEVVSVADSGRPSAGQSVARTAVLFGIAAASAVTNHVGALAPSRTLASVTETLQIVGTVAPALALLVASWRDPNKRAPWDRVAGTMVRYRA